MQDSHAVFGQTQQLFTTTTPRPTTTTTQTPLVDCQLYPERCRDMYYVSETDMLKAMVRAVLDPE